MTDLAEGIETRNYAIERRTDRRNLSDLLCIIFSIAAVAGVLFGYIWVRIEIVNVGYESQRLQATEEALIRIQKNLALEEETLKDPGRIDMLARNELAMMVLRPSQVIPVGFRAEQPGAPITLAMAGSSRRSGTPGKPPANN